MEDLSKLIFFIKIQELFRNCICFNGKTLNFYCQFHSLYQQFWTHYDLFHSFQWNLCLIGFIRGRKWWKSYLNLLSKILLCLNHCFDMSSPMPHERNQRIKNCFLVSLHWNFFFYCNLHYLACLSWHRIQSWYFI